MAATWSDEGEKSCGSVPTGINVIAVESGLAQATMSPTTLPSIVVVDTTVMDGALGSASSASSVEEGSASSSTDEVSSSFSLCVAVASDAVESSELEHATRDPAEARAAAVKRTSLCEVMSAWCP